MLASPLKYLNLAGGYWQWKRQWSDSNIANDHLRNGTNGWTQCWDYLRRWLIFMLQSWRQRILWPIIKQSGIHQSKWLFRKVPTGVYHNLTLSDRDLWEDLSQSDHDPSVRHFPSHDNQLRKINDLHLKLLSLWRISAWIIFTHLQPSVWVLHCQRLSLNLGWWG